MLMMLILTFNIHPVPPELSGYGAQEIVFRGPAQCYIRLTLRD